MRTFWPVADEHLKCPMRRIVRGAWSVEDTTMLPAPVLLYDFTVTQISSVRYYLSPTLFLCFPACRTPLKIDSFAYRDRPLQLFVLCTIQSVPFSPRNIFISSNILSEPTFINSSPCINPTLSIHYISTPSERL